MEEEVEGNSLEADESKGVVVAEVAVLKSEEEEVEGLTGALVDGGDFEDFSKAVVACFRAKSWSIEKEVVVVVVVVVVGDCGDCCCDCLVRRV